MINKLLFAFSFILLLSCVNDKKEKTEENTTNQTKKTEMKDSLAGVPKGDWNGEYYEVDNKRDSAKSGKKSRGAEYFSMGKVVFTFDKQEYEINLFDQKKNAISFSEEHLFAFIRSAFNETVEFYFHAAEITDNALGNYTADTTGSANGTVKLVLNLGQKGEKKRYILTSGNVEIKKFSSQLGSFKAVIKGTFTDQKGNKHQGNGTVNMRFETVVQSMPT